MKEHNKNSNKISAKDMDYIVDSKDALLTKTYPAFKIVLFVIISCLVFFIVWAYFAKIDVVTRGIGKLVPTSQVQVIQNIDGGVLSSLLVKEGQSVKKGEIVAQLDKTRFNSQYQGAYVKYLELKADLARLNAEIEGLSQITFPKEVQNKSQLIKQEKALFNARNHMYNNTVSNLQNSYKDAKHELDLMQSMYKDGVVSQIDLLRTQQQVHTIKSKLDTYKDNFYHENVTNLTNKQNELQILQETLIGLKDKITKATLISPVDGIVEQIHYYTVILPGNSIMEIFPAGDDLLVEAKIKPDDIAFIKKGQAATVKITAYDYSIYGGLKAHVVNISPDTSKDEFGHDYYEVTLKTNENYLGSINKPLPLSSGMQVSVDIITGNKSILSYLLKPILKAKEKVLRES